MQDNEEGTRHKNREQDSRNKQNWQFKNLAPCNLNIERYRYIASHETGF